MFQTTNQIIHPTLKGHPVGPINDLWPWDSTGWTDVPWSSHHWNPCHGMDWWSSPNMSILSILIQVIQVLIIIKDPVCICVSSLIPIIVPQNAHKPLVSFCTDWLNGFPKTNCDNLQDYLVYWCLLESKLPVCFAVVVILHSSTVCGQWHGSAKHGDGTTARSSSLSFFRTWNHKIFCTNYGCNNIPC